MAVKLSSLVARRAHLVIPGADGDLNIDYRPDYYDLQVEERLAASRETGANMKGIAELFCDWLVSWDLQDESGATIPLSVDGLRAARVPVTVLADIIDHIVKDMNPPEA